jgi:glycine dehydrogenase
MLRTLGYESLEEMTDAAVPKKVKLNRYLNLEEPLSEMEVLEKIKKIAARNQVLFKNMQC